MNLELPQQVPSAHGRLDGALVVDIAFTVGADGAVQMPRVLCSNPNDPAYLKALLAAAAHWRFKPVVTQGRARAVQVAYRVTTSGRGARAEPIPSRLGST